MKKEKASAAYNKALLINPDYAKAHYNLGVTLKELGRLEEAEASYRQAITVKPDYAKAHYNLGITLQELGRSKDAEASYRKAITVKPDYVKAHDNLGLVLQTRGNIDAAAAVFRAACNLDPASHMSRFYLHSTYYRDMNTDFDAANPPGGAPPTCSIWFHPGLLHIILDERIGIFEAYDDQLE
jgi:tetratricopeptide (TPR) repeat protein